MKTIVKSVNRRASVVFASVAFNLLLFAGSTFGQTEKKIIVPGVSGAKWVDTEIVVVAGDTIRLEATGKVDVGAGWGEHGPEGTKEFFAQPVGTYPVDSKTRYGLAARITLGSGQKYRATQKWGYGDTKEIKVIRSGMLWLTVNDDAADDNTGEFVVTITTVKKNK